MSSSTDTTGPGEVAGRPGFRFAAHAVTVAALALVAGGVEGSWGAGLHVLAGVALGGFAWAATRTCRDVRRAVASAKPGVTRPPVMALCRWLPLVAWADAMLVTAGS